MREIAWVQIYLRMMTRMRMDRAGAQEGRGLVDRVQVYIMFYMCSLLIVHPANVFGYACLGGCFRYMFDTWDDGHDWIVLVEWLPSVCTRWHVGDISGDMWWFPISILNTVAKLETYHPEINRGLLENHSFVFLGTCRKKGHPKMPKKETHNLMVKTYNYFESYHILIGGFNDNMCFRIVLTIFGMIPQPPTDRFLMSRIPRELNDS